MSNVASITITDVSIKLPVWDRKLKAEVEGEKYAFSFAHSKEKGQLNILIRQHVFFSRKVCAEERKKLYDSLQKLKKLRSF